MEFQILVSSEEDSNMPSSEWCEFVWKSAWALREAEILFLNKIHCVIITGELARVNRLKQVLSYILECLARLLFVWGYFLLWGNDVLFLDWKDLNWIVFLCCSSQGGWGSL